MVLRQWWVGLLVACIPLQGMAMVMERIQGAAHVHVGPVHSSVAATGDAAVYAMAPTRALPPSMPVLLDVSVLRHSHGAPQRMAQSWPASISEALPHDHGIVAQHRHAADDLTVVRIAAADADPDPDVAVGGASKRVLLDVDTPPMHIADSASETSSRSPSRPEVVAFTAMDVERLERPPRWDQP